MNSVVRMPANKPWNKTSGPHDRALLVAMPVAVIWSDEVEESGVFLVTFTELEALGLRH